MLVVHLVANPHYGFFRDELYFIVCGRHPAFGYVDQPPLVPLLAAASQLAGTSLFAIRAVPALLAAGTSYAVGVLAGEIGGGSAAKVLAVLASGLSPVLTSFGTQLGPDSVQMLLWPVSVLFVARALDRDPRWWVPAGLSLGLAGEAKSSAVIFAVCVAAGLLATGRRTVLRSPWPWRGLLAMSLILVPNLAWQFDHGFPMLELLRNDQHGKNVVLGPVAFLMQQVLITNPVLAVVWITGTGWCLARSRWRWLGLATCVLLAIIIALHGKNYYPAPVYPALFAAGGVAIERLTALHRRLRAAILVTVLATGMVFAPLTLPILPEPQLIDFKRLLARAGFRDAAFENHKPAILGQIFADMHGWRQLADLVSKLYSSLPSALRARTSIFASNYGEAAAIDVLGAPSLPSAISGHNQYWLWGSRGWDGTGLLVIGGKPAVEQRSCGSATILGHFSAPYVMPYESGVPITLCLGLKKTVGAVWPRLKHFD